MKLIFFGTGKFGLPTVKKLIASDHEVLAVVTQPDKKQGRGMNVQPSPVKALVEQIAPAIDILQPLKASDAEFVDTLKAIGADLFIVVDYGQILSKEVLEVPPKYCINLHPSLLPKYRGASPVNRVILNGDIDTGNTIIKMTEKMDAGHIIMQEMVKARIDEDVHSLFDRLSGRGADLMMKALEEIASGREHFTPQNETKASYAPKLKKKEGLIDWSDSARGIFRKVIGLRPWPGAFTYYNGKVLKILEAEVIATSDSEFPPGTVSDNKNFIVNAGEGSLRIYMLQLEGKKAMSAEEFMRGHAVEKGIILGK